MVGEEHRPGQACGVAVLGSAQVSHQLAAQALPKAEVVS